MVGYIVVKVANDEDYDRKIGTILSFDWEGHPQKAYDVGLPVISFDVDWSARNLYCLIDAEEPYVLCYKL